MSGWQESEYRRARERLQEAKRNGSDARTVSRLQSEADAAYAKVADSYRAQRLNPPPRLH